MADGMEQVRLAQAHSAVNEERVVGLGWQFGDGLGSGLSELVRRPDDERIKGVSRIQSLDSATRGRYWRGRRRRRRRGRAFLDDNDRQARLPAKSIACRRLQHAQMVLKQPVAVKAVGDSDASMITFGGAEAARTDPGIHDGGR